MSGPDRIELPQEGMAALRERFRGVQLERVAIVEQAALALIEGGLEEEQRRDAERAAHKLAGSYGLAEGSGLAREIEEILSEATPREGGRAQGVRLAHLLWVLRQELGRSLLPASAPEPPAPRGPARPLVLIVEGDEEVRAALLREAEARDLEAEAVADIAAARAALNMRPPDVVLLGLLGPPGLGFLSSLAAHAPPVPAVVLAEADALPQRVDVARLGGCGFLHRPTAPREVFDAVARALEASHCPEATILAVDDDPLMLAVLGALLPPPLRLVPLVDPLRFWEVLEETTPDLLLLDFELPGLSGLELCRVVRSDPRWDTLPILFLTAQTDPGSVRQAFQAGADDLVSKPVAGPELMGRILNRLARARLQHRLADRDALTGLCNRRRATENLEQLLRLSRRQGQPLCLAMLDLDSFKQVNDRHGHAAGDVVLRRLAQLLSRSLRGEDVVARWGGEEFVVGLYGSSRADGVRRIGRFLELQRAERFSGEGGETFAITFSAGVAEHPTDGADLDGLVAAADKALYRAKGAGRARVLPAEAASGAPRAAAIGLAPAERKERRPADADPDHHR